MFCNEVVWFDNCSHSVKWLTTQLLNWLTCLLFLSFLFFSVCVLIYKYDGQVGGKVDGADDCICPTQYLLLIFRFLLFINVISCFDYNIYSDSFLLFRHWWVRFCGLSCVAAFLNCNCIPEHCKWGMGFAELIKSFLCFFHVY